MGDLLSAAVPTNDAPVNDLSFCLGQVAEPVILASGVASWQGCFGWTAIVKMTHVWKRLSVTDNARDSGVYLRCCGMGYSKVKTDQMVGISSSGTLRIELG